MAEFIAYDESTPLTDKQMEYMVRKSKICKLANLLREIKYPVFPGGSYTADLGVQFGSHVYDFIAEYLIDHGVEVDVVHCQQCKSWEQYNACDGSKPHRCMNHDAIFYKRTEPNGFCFCGERRESDG